MSKLHEIPFEKHSRYWKKQRSEAFNLYTFVHDVYGVNINKCGADGPALGRQQG
jgi:hypothetical protein